MIFHIDSDTGAITLGKNLDRETAGWHNITVKAVEAGKWFAVLNWAYHTWVVYHPPAGKGMLFMV